MAPKKKTAKKASSGDSGKPASRKTSATKKNVSVTKKTSSKKVVDKPGKGKTTMNTQKKEKPLTKKEIEEFRLLLMKKRAELLGVVDQMQNGALNSNPQETAGELSSMPIHMADVGTDNYEKEFTLGLIESERNLLKEIDLALLKINKGIYGICEVTGKFIGRARLSAKPEARFHIDIARKIEQGLMARPEIKSFTNKVNEEKE